MTEQQRSELNEIAQSRSLPAGFVFRAKLIQMLAEEVPFTVIKDRLQTTAPTISRWKQRSWKMDWKDCTPIIQDNRRRC